MNTEPRKTVEHDVDILLLEEINVSPHFRRWLVEMATGTDVVNLTFVNAWRSVSATILGESDVVFIYAVSNGEKRAILVEDKVTSPAQPAQGERYRLRGKAGVESAKWNGFATLLLAPQDYLSKSTDASRFDAQLSYESLRDWFLASSPGDVRMEYKASVIERGITRMKDGWARIGNATVTDFFRNYWLLANREFKRLALKEPSDIPEGLNEISYPSPEIDKRRGLRLAHKFERGYVDLMVKNARHRVDQLRKNNEKLLPPDVIVVPAGKKSAAFRIVIPDAMDRTQPFDDQAEVARTAMKLGIRLLELSFNLQIDT